MTTVVEDGESAPDITTVVVDASGNSEDSDALEVGLRIGHMESEIARLSAENAELRSVAESAAAAASAALATSYDTADAVADTAEAVAEETAEEIVEEASDETDDDGENNDELLRPDREHPLWKGGIKFRGRN